MERCPICDLPTTGVCPNYWCGRPDRGFDVVWAVAEHTGDLRRAIAGLKYRAERRWAVPLGELLASYLLDHAPCFEDIDLIVATPCVVGGGRPLDHVQTILGAATPFITGLWPVDEQRDPVLVLREPTRPMVGTPSAAVRRLWAACELRAALAVTDARRVGGRRMLAVDDVFTDGSTLREVAGALLGAGAEAVSGLVLARAPMAGHGFP